MKTRLDCEVADLLKQCSRGCTGCALSQHYYSIILKGLFQVKHFSFFISAAMSKETNGHLNMSF